MRLCVAVLLLCMIAVPARAKRPQLTAQGSTGLTYNDNITLSKTDVNFGPERFGDLRYFVADTRRFQQATGWTPRVTPRDGVARLVRWVVDHPELFAAAAVTA